MDLTRDHIYRGYTINDSSLLDNLSDHGLVGEGLSGSIIDTFDPSDVDVVQYIEKRSQQDGMDAGDVFLGMRTIRIAGSLFATSRPLLFDAYRALRAALNPVLAMRDEPADHGYQPYYFSIPTADTENWPSGLIFMRVLALPRAVQMPLQRDHQGGEDWDSLAIPWQATMICRDPSFQAVDPQDTVLTNVTTNSGDIVNRGNYITNLNMLVVVGTAAGSLSCSIGDSLFTITIPVSTGVRVIRFKGDDKVLTVQEGADVDHLGAEAPRMDLLTFTGDTTWPNIAPGTAAFSVTKSGVTIGGGSHFWFYEHFA
jgi:hypothetical protein